MKKLVLLLMAMFFVPTLVSCSNQNNEKSTPYESVNTIKNVSMTIKDETVTPKGLTVIITDTNDSPYIYGESYEVEKKVNDEWTTLPVVVKGAYGFNEIGLLMKGNTMELNVDWEWLYGLLENGEYRILKSLYIDGYQYFSAEFSIK